MIERSDTDLLVWFFEKGAELCARSAFAPLLERQRALAFDHTGRRVGRAEAWTHARSVAFRQRPTEATFALDEDAVLSAASVARRLKRLALASPEAVATLEAYFGARGAAAAHTRFGRLLAIVPLVPSGTALAREVDRVRFACATDAYQALAELIEERRRDPARAVEARACLAHAEGCLLFAWRAWKQTGREPRRSLRRAGPRSTPA